MKKLLSSVSRVILAVTLVACACLNTSVRAQQKDYLQESRAEFEARMKWWNEARFGMFIHWGLYAIPAGEWGGKTGYGEWIRNSAQIPVNVYDTFTGYFNPVKFNAEEWASLAKEAGAQYIVITSKHHDGFCLFDSEQTDFDVMSTPFKRDIMKELSDACRGQGLQMCWYYSIMDWHHPDYIPRRDWEAATRPADGADFNRYVTYMKNQLNELLSHYGSIGVLWFDGEWESTWNNAYGRDLYNYVRGLQPEIIVNNRVGTGRDGLEGFSSGKDMIGDYGTPEQTIPATGIPGTYWETCMTMNDHWGYNSHDLNFKSTEDLLRKLADIASKGGNFLLNVGPTKEGVIPEASVTRLREIGAWMKVNGESIYGTLASPFESLSWGRCTQKAMPDGTTRLYLHVFQAPADGKLVVPGIYNIPVRAYLLADASKKEMKVSRKESDLVISLPKNLPDRINTVVVMDINGRPDIWTSPEIDAVAGIFLDSLTVNIKTGREEVEIRYTLDGKEPGKQYLLYNGPFTVKNSTEVKARLYRNGKAVSPVAARTFTNVAPWPALDVPHPRHGISFRHYTGTWDSLPDFSKLTPADTGIMEEIAIESNRKEESFGYRFNGYVYISDDGVYEFSTDSDDGSNLYVDGKKVVDNDGLHALTLKSGLAPLQAGVHAITVDYFEQTGGNELKVYFRKVGETRRSIPNSCLMH